MSEKGRKAGLLTIRKIILISWPYMLGILVFLCTRLAIRNPGFVETYYSDGIYPYLERFLSSITRHLPFSLWDTFWSGVIIIVILGLVLIVFRKIKFRWFGLRITQLIAILYSLFYFVWGFNYFRPALEKRIGLEKPDANGLAFRSILDTLIKNTNQNYISISPSDYPEIDSLIGESYLKNGKTLGINFSTGSVNPKTMIYSSFFAKTGVNGYFGPFFNEINLNYYMLSLEYPFALAHEKAHQLGISNEAEANFAAFLISTLSDDSRLRYSGNFFMLSYFLSDAAHLKDYQEYVKKIDKQVILDFQYRRKYYLGLQKERLKKMQNTANNAYLKTNNISHGIRNYNHVVSLVIGWYASLNNNQ